MAERIGIIGDGQMGLVLADALAHQGHQAVIWGPFADQVEQLNQSRTSSRLSGFELPQAIDVTADEQRAWADADVLLNAIPTQYIRPVWQRLRDSGLQAGEFQGPIVCVSKGIENDTLLRPSEIMLQVLGAGESEQAICALSGPTIAAELAARQPATMLAACADDSVSQRVQALFDAPWLRVYRHADITGVEIAGAAKNVIALAAGMVDGLGAGVNAKSALLSRGLAEIARLGTAMGGTVETFFGVAGVGDLATSCFSLSGRNRSCGEALAKGVSLEDHLHSTASVVEGVPTTKSIVQLADQLSVDMPITREVHAILFEGLSPREAIVRLMEREKKAERIA